MGRTRGIGDLTVRSGRSASPVEGVACKWNLISKYARRNVVAVMIAMALEAHWMAAPILNSAFAPAAGTRFFT
jgi:hypothetical protein